MNIYIVTFTLLDSTEKSESRIGSFLLRLSVMDVHNQILKFTPGRMIFFIAEYLLNANDYFF